MFSCSYKFGGFDERKSPRFTLKRRRPMVRIIQILEEIKNLFRIYFSRRNPVRIISPISYTIIELYKILKNVFWILWIKNFEFRIIA